MIQCSLLTFVSPLLPCLPVSLLLQTWDEFADNTAPQFPVLILMKLVVMHVALATAGVVAVCVYVFFLSLHISSTQEMTADLMHQLVRAEGECIRVHVQTCWLINLHAFVHNWPHQVTVLALLTSKWLPKNTNIHNCHYTFQYSIWQKHQQKSWPQTSSGRSSTEIFHSSPEFTFLTKCTKIYQK